MSVDVILKDRSGTDITYDASGGVSLLTPDNSRRLFYPASDDPGYITFSSPGAFTLQVNCIANNKNWSGTLEYSTDQQTWVTIPGFAASTTITSGTGNRIYLRGHENAYLAGDVTAQSEPVFRLTGNNISVSGNIGSLLDSESVKCGVVPAMGSHAFEMVFANNANLVSAENLVLPCDSLSYCCYQRMFQNCSSMVAAPELPATQLAQNCYYYMFYGCSSLIDAPALPAMKMEQNCYGGMFYGCSSLTETPQLPATELSTVCYASMFYYCSNITRIAKLPAINISQSAYYTMYSNCSSLKLSTTQTGIYQYPFRMPTDGTGTAQSSSFTNMFRSTGGTFTGTPTVNTTYYTDHEPV